MTDNQDSDPYAAVIADLRAQRDKIEETIAVLEGFRGGIVAATGISKATARAEGVAIVETAGMFLGLSIVDATKKLLSSRKQTLGNAEIARALQAGGLAMTSKDPVNTVGSVLTRRFNEVGDVVKVGRGIWGLKEWYPGRNFKSVGRTTPLMAAGKPGMDSDEEPDWPEDGDTPMTPNPDITDLIG